MKDILDDTGYLRSHTKKSLLKVIRAKCLDCCGDQPSEIRLCQASDCSLWPYRMGKNPFHKRKMTDNQKHVATERLKAQKSES